MTDQPSTPMNRAARRKAARQKKADAKRMRRAIRSGERKPPCRTDEGAKPTGAEPTFGQLIAHVPEDSGDRAENADAGDDDAAEATADTDLPDFWSVAALKTSSADTVLAYLAVERAAPPEILRGLADRRPLAIAVVMPSESWAAHVQLALDRIVYDLRGTPSLHNAAIAGQHHSRFAGQTQTPRAGRVDMTEFARSLARGGRLIVHTDSEATLPPDLRLVLDAVIRIPPPDASLLAATIRCVTGEMPDAAALEGLRGLTLETIAMVVRRRSTAEDCVRRLRLASERLTQVHADASVPPLEACAGYGEAGAWGLALARDFERLRAGLSVDLPRGILLVGLPGTGKTLFARALARSCGVPLTYTSVGAWFATGEGHLGDIARAAKAVIDQARAAGGILFIDEIDSLSDRNAEAGRNRGFQVQFVNTVLAMIDGCLGSPGFVLVGACNDASRVDPALRRAGRLDREITIPLPDAAARTGILRMHLGEDLADADLGPIVRATEGRSGADLARYVRDARQAAREVGRPLTLGDLAKAALPPDPRTPREIRLSAIHEAGHAIAALRLGRRILRADIALEADAGGGIAVELVRHIVSPEDIVADVVILLCGRAADEILGDGPHAGAGGHPDSDLARATRLVTAAHTSFGLRGRLAFRGPHDAAEKVVLYDPALAARIEAELQELYTSAQALITKNVAQCDAIAESLVDRRVLNGEEITAIVAKIDVAAAPRHRRPS